MDRRVTLSEEDWRIVIDVLSYDESPDGTRLYEELKDQALTGV